MCSLGRSTLLGWVSSESHMPDWFRENYISVSLVPSPLFNVTLKAGNRSWGKGYIGGGGMCGSGGYLIIGVGGKEGYVPQTLSSHTSYHLAGRHSMAASGPGFFPELPLSYIL